MTEFAKETWGMACPKCVDDLLINVAATIWVRLSPEGTDPYEAKNQDHERNHSSAAFCCTCGHHGTVASFTEP